MNMQFNAAQKLGVQQQICLAGAIMAIVPGLFK